MRGLSTAIAAVVIGFCGGAANAGTLFYSQDSNGNGLFTLDTTTGAATNVGISSVTSSNKG
ncbi:MAG: hypothetical protein AAGC81_11220 [Pseudomonadota bacterium]